MTETTGLGSIPHIVLGLYLLVLLAFGIQGYRRRQNESEEDYYLAGRSQGWVVSSLTIMATFFSSFALLGAPGMVYRDGVVFALFSLNVPVAGVAIYLLGAKIRKIGRDHGYVTPADMIAAHYQSRVGLRLLVAFVGLLYAVPYVVMQIQAGGILSQQLFPGRDAFEIGAALLALITMVYIMVGGMRSVAWTDVVQGGLLVGGMLLAGVAVVWVLGGPISFFASVAKLPPRSLSAPGTSGRWTPEILFTASLFAALGSMIQPAQWMRFYAARSADVLRRSALIFAAVLTLCFFFGVMLVGLGGQVLYPLTDAHGSYLIDTAGKVLPHPAVGQTAGEFDQILVVVLKNHLPDLLGSFGAVLAALVLVAIMAAAMSTADSNLHALSALITHDIYDQFIRPQSSQREKIWVGRLIIALVTGLALFLVILGRQSEHNPLGMIVVLGLLAIAFSTQLLPLTVDMLYLHRGTRQGAIAGLCVGVATIFLLSPFFSMLAGDALKNVLGSMKSMIDTGAWGLCFNVLTFAIVSHFTRAKTPAD
ncbi:MAG: sodium:solute symporter family protein [Candidatus Latescibacterota bacterium]|nr:sodium:solute symporter family protein [Candidatus Latescibacterota bacterium]